MKMYACYKHYGKYSNYGKYDKYGKYGKDGKKTVRMLVRFFLITFILFGFCFSAKETFAKTVKMTVKSYYSGKCDERDIQDCLDMAETYPGDKYNIRVPKGTYTLTKSLHIYSNTTLNLKGVTLKRDKTFERGGMIVVGNPRQEYGDSDSPGGGYTIGGYERGKNITILGGVLDAGTRTENVTTLCTFSHVSNITIKGTVFKYLPKTANNAHMIEFGAGKNVKITDCKFIGNQKLGEAVQIESAVKGVAGSDLMGKLDGTRTKNVTLSGCTFSNFQYAFGTNHGCSKDIYTNMVISKNTFKHISKYAICTYNYSKAKISGNVLSGSGKRSFDASILKLGQKDSYIKSGNKVK